MRCPEGARKKPKHFGQFKELLQKLAGPAPRRPPPGPRTPSCGRGPGQGREQAPGPELEPRPPRGERDEEPSRGEQLPAFDPLVRSLAHPVLAAPVAPPPAPAPEPAALPVLPLDVLLNRLVKRAAWGGDGRRGAARLTLGAGRLDGATITVVSEPDGLSVEVELPPGTDGDALCRRLADRLEQRGLVVRDITVR